MFRSSASNLVPLPFDGNSHIYIRDRQLSTTELISVSSTGERGDGISNALAISVDGRFVAFSSTSTNLVANDTNGVEDIFLRDRLLGTTTRVSVDSFGVQANNFSMQLAISGDGNYVAFRSLATNLITDDTNGSEDIFVHNRQTGVTERVSLTSTGNQVSGGYFDVSLNGDGRYVVFSSNASNLVPNDTNGTGDVFLKDRQTGNLDRISVSTNDDQGNDVSVEANISSNGQYVVFKSAAQNLISGDTNTWADIFVRDLTPIPTPTPTQTPTSTPTPTVTPTPTPVLIGPPTDKDECKDGGWQIFNNPTFKNQGECVSYVNHHS